jgi:hypothetical protein
MYHIQKSKELTNLQGRYKAEILRAKLGASPLSERGDLGER